MIKHLAHAHAQKRPSCNLFGFVSPPLSQRRRGGGGALRPPPESIRECPPISLNHRPQLPPLRVQLPAAPSKTLAAFESLKRTATNLMRPMCSWRGYQPCHENNGTARRPAAPYDAVYGLFAAPSISPNNEADPDALDKPSPRASNISRSETHAEQAAKDTDRPTRTPLAQHD